MADQAPASHRVTPTPIAAATELSLAASFDETYAAVIDSVSLARRSIAHWLRSLKADELMSGDVALAVSEACTNAVLHAHGNGNATDGSFRVLVQSHGDLVRMTVSDDGCGMAPRVDGRGLGFGLPLMAALTDSLHVRPAAEGSGTVVSMLFTAAGARARTPADRGGPDAPPRG